MTFELLIQSEEVLQHV